MFRRSIVFASLAAGALLGAATAAAQGLSWDSETNVAGKKENQKYYYMPGMFKAVTGRGQEMVMRLDRETIASVDREKKEYWEMTFDELETFMKKAQGMMDSRMAEMRKQMEGMPEEQRKMMEQMLGPAGPGAEGAIAVKPMPDKKVINGYNCTKVIVTQGKREAVTLWTTRDVKEYAGMAKEWQEFGKRMAQLTPTVGRAMAEGISRIDGFPIRVEAGGMTSEVKNVRKSTTPASEFTVPAGYKRVQPDFMEEMGKEADDPGQ